MRRRRRRKRLRCCCYWRYSFPASTAASIVGTGGTALVRKTLFKASRRKVSLRSIFAAAVLSTSNRRRGARPPSSGTEPAAPSRRPIYRCPERQNPPGILEPCRVGIWHLANNVDASHSTAPAHPRPLGSCSGGAATSAAPAESWQVCALCPPAEEPRGPAAVLGLEELHESEVAVHRHVLQSSKRS